LKSSAAAPVHSRASSQLDAQSVARKPAETVELDLDVGCGTAHKRRGLFLIHDLEGEA
jgi:hypothetical protein